MVRFSCFHAHINSPKTKKTVLLSVEAMEKTLEDCTLNNGLKDFTNSSGLNSVDLKEEEGSFLDTGANDVTSSSSVEHGSKSDEINTRFPQIKGMKKSFSLGNGLYMEGRVSVGNHFEVERDQEFSCEFYGDHGGLVVPFGGKDPEISLPNQFLKALPSDSFQISSDLVNNESIFSIGDTHQSEKEGYENCDRQYFGECAGASSDHMRHTRPVITKSSSLPNMVSLSGHSALRYSVSYPRSSEDLHNLDSRRKEMSVHEVGSQVLQDREIGFAVSNNEKNNGENPADDVYDSYNYVGSAKDWIIPVMDGMNTVKKFQRESSAGHQDELPSKDFKTKRIEEWVIDLQYCSPEEWDTDLQHCSPLEETDELSNSENHQVQRGADILDNFTAARLDGKVTPGMVAVKRYLSSLSPTATTAHLANHGLVVIPFLSAFVSLKELNLSGNAIVRITAGALPRGLHVLNLSKNSISTIEGLRELTRLRVLNLSYNRLLRIGHGLASCSSLKELYVAGNKISEVEGLHRLLKLHVLDLRFNKISTAKCLGQLAANYNSLQAISLEGNPAQKNVGDEQLKKYLLGLLPHLAYFNRRPIKAGSLKDSSDRSARLGISAHQVDRGLRSEHRTLRKGSHGVATHKTSSTSIHGRRSQAVDTSKQHKGRHARLPPTGTRTTSHRHHFYDFGSKLLHFKTEKSIRKSRSEGTLAAL